MKILILVVQLVTLGVLVLAKSSGAAYFPKKGENLATKQDVAKITREIESVKASFREHETRATTLHLKRFEVIAEVYARLRDATEFVQYVVHPVQYGGDDEEMERRTQAHDAKSALSSFYWKHKIYLPVSICEQIEEVLSTINKAFTKYVFSRRGDAGSGRTEMWAEAYESMKEEVPQLQHAIEALFREAIEVHSLPGDSRA